ncbi:hypothetical protein AHiyo6_34030 [Arthrobacter sp. Hiyo6]|nr:hypothetical protein AHiyo6_34030 [Arthrobacter sp. Hiyo6]
MRSSRVCPAKGCVHFVHTFVHGRLFARHFDPFLMVLPTPLHAGLCCRRHDFAAQAPCFAGRSGFGGNVFGGVCGWRTIRRQSAGVWDPDSSSGAVLLWLIRKTCSWWDARLSFSSHASVGAVPAKKGVPRRRAVGGCRASQSGGAGRHDGEGPGGSALVRAERLFFWGREPAAVRRRPWSWRVPDGINELARAPSGAFCPAKRGCADCPHRCECSAVDRLWLPSLHTSMVGFTARRDRRPHRGGRRREFSVGAGVRSEYESYRVPCHR